MQFVCTTRTAVCTVDKGCKTTLSVARHQKSNDSKKVGYYHCAVCAKCHAWTKAGSKQITMRDGFQYPFQSKKKGGKDKVALVNTEQKPEPPVTCLLEGFEALRRAAAQST